MFSLHLTYLRYIAIAIPIVDLTSSNLPSQLYILYSPFATTTHIDPLVTHSLSPHSFEERHDSCFTTSTILLLCCMISCMFVFSAIVCEIAVLSICNSTFGQ